MSVCGLLADRGGLYCHPVERGSGSGGTGTAAVATPCRPGPAGPTRGGDMVDGWPEQRCARKVVLWSRHGWDTVDRLLGSERLPEGLFVSATTRIGVERSASLESASRTATTAHVHRRASSDADSGKEPTSTWSPCGTTSLAPRISRHQPCFSATSTSRSRHTPAPGLPRPSTGNGSASSRPVPPDRQRSRRGRPG